MRVSRQQRERGNHPRDLSLPTFSPARALHVRSSRAHRSWLPMDCAAAGERRASQQRRPWQRQPPPPPPEAALAQHPPEARLGGHGVYGVQVV